MQTISLDVTGRSANGGVHATVLINEQDTGKLYLTADEFELLSSVLLVGAREHKNTLYESTDLNEEFDLDVFDFDE